MPSSWTGAISASREIGGAHDVGAVAAEVLALEVVELAGRQDDLAGQRRARPAAVATLEDRDLDLAADDRRLDEHLLVLGEGQLERLVELATVVHLRDADARPSPRGLDEHRQAEGSGIRSHARPGRAPSRARVTVTHGETGTPAACRTIFMKCLSMHERRIQHAAARVRDAERVEEALHRAVLAVDAVQDRKHDIDGAELSGRAVARRTRSARSAPPSGHRMRVPLSTTSGRRSASSANLSGSSSSRTKTPSRVIPTGITR